MMPPMVGVPRLLKCDSGPSLRTTWPKDISCRRLITRGPIHSDRNSAVSRLTMARNVR
ncbi:Uncharacterised protein [Acinetobacter baumannii]|nr:Uncharacterised protein [Acinetobacter baumannii]